MQGEPSAYPGLDRPNGEQQQQKEAATAHQSALLDYERQIVQGLVEEDSLCIMSSGMGWQKVGIPCIMPVHCKHVQAWWWYRGRGRTTSLCSQRFYDNHPEFVPRDGMQRDGKVCDEAAQARSDHQWGNSQAG